MDVSHTSRSPPALEKLRRERRAGRSRSGRSPSPAGASRLAKWAEPNVAQTGSRSMQRRPGSRRLRSEDLRALLGCPRRR